jgi:hypothetical protein
MLLSLPLVDPEREDGAAAEAEVTLSVSGSWEGRGSGRECDEDSDGLIVAETENSAREKKREVEVVSHEFVASGRLSSERVMRCQAVDAEVANLIMTADDDRLASWSR